MSILHAAAVTCFGVGVAVVVLSGLAALRVRRPQDRLHFLTPMTALGTPMVGLGLVLEDGWTLTSVQIVLTCLLVMITAPVLTSSAMRVILQRDGDIPRESPE